GDDFSLGVGCRLTRRIGAGENEIRSARIDLQPQDARVEEGDPFAWAGSAVGWPAPLSGIVTEPGGFDAELNRTGIHGDIGEAILLDGAITELNRSRGIREQHAASTFEAWNQP